MITPDDVAASLGKNEGGFGRDQQSYYDLPVLHRPHWGWEIEWYFFIGGVASGSAILAALSDVIQDERDRPVIRLGRYAATLGAMASGALLVKDLGRPERFLHMMRIFKLKSPMSVGVYAISVFSALSGIALLRQAKADGLIPFDPAGFVPSLEMNILWAGSAALLGSYTGVLIGATAIPVWFVGSKHIPAAFVCSATSTACAFTMAVLSVLPGTSSITMRKIERLEILAAVSEWLLLRDYRIRAGVLGAPLFEGKIGKRLDTMTKLLGIAVPVVLNLPSAFSRGEHHPTKTARARTLLAAALTLTGGLVFRQCILRAGKVSATDPRDYLNHKERTPSSAP